MYIIQCPTIVKYNGEKYPAHSPFAIDDEHIEDLKKIGAVVIQQPASSKGSSDDDELTPNDETDSAGPKFATEAAIKTMKTAQLEEYAILHRIDLHDCTTNKERVAAILAAQAQL